MRTGALGSASAIVAVSVYGVAEQNDVVAFDLTREFAAHRDLDLAHFDIGLASACARGWPHRGRPR